VYAKEKIVIRVFFLKVIAPKMRLIKITVFNYVSAKTVSPATKVHLDSNSVYGCLAAAAWKLRRSQQKLLITWSIVKVFKNACSHVVKKIVFKLKFCEMFPTHNM
jgi:hypothetical protein